eukprot:CAMPEP_0202443066 /NCGR_PEP_ID=MMETSP1360-20130828/2424_1 /ASSEMBLY_ACC=CAM_ASM_000848 /TAXON_ID=515479 /ORGANISM="Licmophora paradoxa, Strain CCMP2313" /LENGTH=48 /DNA_ID= /DNA_START= /DNA_END= /DNA_ORIENTATION=
MTAVMFLDHSPQMSGMPPAPFLAILPTLKEAILQQQNLVLLGLLKMEE